ncbi:MAG TPA: DUF1571 domain-containing protein [Bacteroidia bacterium]|nr:DUF1571 domain-containing protein [Bacteroidia bacterium]
MNILITLKRSIFLFCLLAGILISSSFRNSRPAQVQEVVNAKTIMDNMSKSAQALSTLSFNLKIQERVNGKFRNSLSSVKLQRKPRKIYMKLNGPEVLFVEGWNEGKVLVNPAGFPYINLNLDVNSGTLHKDQHHTLNEVGYDFLTDIIRDAIQRCGSKFDDYFKYEGETTWNTIPCYQVKVTDLDYKFITYIVGKGETLISIARKLKLSEFKLGELNKISDYGAVKEGKALVIPSSYARMTELIIDKKTWLPLSTKVYDNNGLFEAYEYLNLKINPGFAADEFSKDFKGYGF